MGTFHGFILSFHDNNMENSRRVCLLRLANLRNNWLEKKLFELDCPMIEEGHHAATKLTRVELLGHRHNPTLAFFSLSPSIDADVKTFDIFSNDRRDHSVYLLSSRFIISLLSVCIPVYLFSSEPFTKLYY